MFQPISTIALTDGPIDVREYLVDAHGTMRRKTPKVRGKRARKADKERRRALRHAP